MASGKVYEDDDDSHVANALLFKNKRLRSSSKVIDSFWVANSSPIFHGSTSMVNFEDIIGENSTEKPFFTPIDTKIENTDEDFDGLFHQSYKKRRLLPDQVRFLEKSFDVENKLEPERKVQLAKELGLQPRQVAIWFQNRRARYKTKHIEKEFDVLKAAYDKLKEDYDTLYKENEKLKNEVHLLSEKFENGEKKIEQVCDPMSPLDVQLNDASNVVQENSGRSDVFDSESSRDEDEGEIECFDDLQPNSCNLGFPVQDQGTWFWPY